MTFNLRILTSRLESEKAVEVSSSTYRDLFYEDSHFGIRRLNDLLTWSQRKVLTAVYFDPPTFLREWPNLPGTSPVDFAEALNVIIHDLKEGVDIYPKEFKLNGELRTDWFEIDNSRCYIEGYTSHLDYPSHVKLFCVDTTQPAKETYLSIGAEQHTLDFAKMRFALVHRTAYDKYRNVLEQLLEQCAKAMKMDSKVLWYFLS